MKILGISGSIRKASYNTKVLQFVGKHIAKSQPEVNYEIADISQLPLFNEDIEANGAKPPQVVTDFRQKVVLFTPLLTRIQVKEADAIVFSTPEHNYSTPAALKNALDWASRYVNHQPLTL
jgi:chromate reductase